MYYISCITVSEADVFIFFMRFPADDRLYAALFFIYLGNVGKASYVLYLVVIFPDESGADKDPLFFFSKAHVGVSWSITKLRPECYAIRKTESMQNRNKRSTCLRHFDTCVPSTTLSISE